jgi:hypothetical protein
MKPLIWKEWMELRYIPIASTVAFLAFALAMAIEQRPQNDSSFATDVSSIISLLWPAAGLLAGCRLFSSDSERGALQFLKSLPLSSASIWRQKIVSGATILCAALTGSGLLWAVALACFGNNAAPSQATQSGDWLVLLIQPFWIFTIAAFVSALVKRPLYSAILAMAVCAALQGAFDHLADPLIPAPKVHPSQASQLLEAALMGITAPICIVLSYRIFVHVPDPGSLKRYRIPALAILGLLVIFGGIRDFQQTVAQRKAIFGLNAATAVRMRCGEGGAVGAFIADTKIALAESDRTTDNTDTFGVAAPTYAGAIDTSGVADPAPQSVYQSGREAVPGIHRSLQYMAFDKSLHESYKVRLHFCENKYNAPGKRLFNVALMGTVVLRNFDIFAAARGAHKACVREFTAKAHKNDHGINMIGIRFSNLKDQAIVSGIEVLPNGPGAAAPEKGGAK